MIEAITYDEMIKELQKRYKGKNKTFAVLLVRPNNSDVSQEILSNITYFHHRSGRKIDIFLPGYGAYWGELIPDSKDVCNLDDVIWSFSTKHFVNYIDELESKSTFTYRGGSELILFDFQNDNICFNNVVRIKLNKALRDGAIDSVEEFIENVIGIFIKKADAFSISDRLTLNELGKSIGDELAEEFALLRVFKRSAHYTINSYSK